MKYHPQTKFGNPGGNCFATCLACVLDLDSPDEVPNFCCDVGEGGDWVKAASDWVRPRFGLGLINLRSPEGVEAEKGAIASVLDSSGAYYIAGVQTQRGHLHAVVYRSGRLIHDPYPGGSKLVGGPLDYTIFFAVDPAKSIAKERASCGRPWWKKRWLKFPRTVRQSG